MRTVADAETAAWLTSLPAGTEAFDWDDGNKCKNLKHDVSWEDVESVFDEEFLFDGRIVEPRYDEPRYVLVGSDRKARTLLLIFTRRGDTLRPISCRPLSRQERRKHE